MNTHIIITAGFATLALTSCQLFEPAPAADSGFNRSTARTETRAAFLQQTWVTNDFRGKPIKDRFSSVYIAPVNTRFMAKQSWWQQQTNARQVDLAKDTQDFAQRMRSQFQNDIAKTPLQHSA